MKGFHGVQAGADEEVVAVEVVAGQPQVGQDGGVHAGAEVEVGVVV